MPVNIRFNNRSYDNHILYTMMMGYRTEEIFELSQAIIDDSRGNIHAERSRCDMYNLTYSLVDHDVNVTSHIDLKEFKSMDDIYRHFFIMGRLHGKKDGYNDIEVTDIKVTEVNQ